MDDDDNVRGIVAESLEMWGYVVLQAENGQEALRMLDDAPELRLMVTDIRMAGLSGLELAALALARRGDLRVIFISGYFEPQKLSARVLKKPFTLGELDAAVRAELQAPPRLS